MTYYPDLTRYSYDVSDHTMLNVGWLARGRPFRTGIVNERVVEALAILSAAYDNHMRGVHFCEFCTSARPVVLGGPALDTEVWLGSAEIRVRGTDGTAYAAPNLVIHYIAQHRYCPPEQFCRAATETAGVETLDELILPD
ncbi:DUF7919 family protein [Streptomyces cinereospinus]|uniref:DUF7919 domain-containing protein n=1 Tax=Streptomyces cinereospinus TaxID=285561 RepID=A0ABV5MUQ2_9ACTN